MRTKKILILDRTEELAEQVRGALAEMNESIEVVPCTRIGSIGHLHEHEGPFDAMIAGSSLATRAGLRRLAMIHREQPEMAIVIAFSKRPEASLREIIQVGADDLIELPTEDMTVRAVVKRAIDIAGRTGRRVLPAAAPLSEPVPQAKPLGRVYTVSSPTGGCGKTFYAANLAHFLSAHTSGRVAIVDLDLQFGEMSTALRLKAPHTIYDVLAQATDDGIDLAEHIEEYLAHYGDRFSVLTAPKEPSQADRITPVEVTKVIDALRRRFDYVVVDTPAALAETVLAAFDVSEHLFVMATLDLPSVRNLSVFLQTLTKLRIPTENVSLVLNKVEKDVGIEAGEIVKLFPQGFRSTLPYAKEVSRSINFGKPVLEAYPAAEVSRKLSAGLHGLLPEEDRARAGELEVVREPGRFGRLFRRNRVATMGATAR